MNECIEMTKLKEALDARGINYKEERMFAIEYENIVYPYDELRIRIVREDGSYLRVSFEEGAKGYYVRDTGYIYEDLTLEEVLNKI